MATEFDSISVEFDSNFVAFDSNLTESNVIFSKQAKNFYLIASNALISVLIVFS